ncbi:MAG: hypothetical protein P1V81_15600 [Planctomycetota bacterium]|nr:hypothetical protein [Planctomycetota bacterium]
MLALAPLAMLPVGLAWGAQAPDPCTGCGLAPTTLLGETGSEGVDFQDARSSFSWRPKVRTIGSEGETELVQQGPRRGRLGRLLR